jgi:hypothetical protein
MQTGSIIDFYDDPQGLVLKTKLGAEHVPDFIKTAEFLDESQRGSLPDDVYALVMIDQGEKFRKYACVDKGNAALSVIYFLENRDRLPEEAQKVAAANLLTACKWHGLQPPAPLMKVAGLLGAAMNASWMKSAVSEGSKRHNKLMRGIPKVGDLTGSNVMPLSSDTEKTASVGDIPDVMQPHVDVTGKSAPPRIEKIAHQRFALVKEGQGRFPIDTYGDVLEADRWFNDHGETLHPEDRRELCTKLAARADEIGCKVTDYVKKYAGVGYAPDGEVRVAVSTRMQYFQDDSPERDMLTGLMDKYAHVPPDVFCEAVRQFDEATGLDHHWDDGVYDPWYTTYGFEKVAEWSFSTHGDRINEEQLNQVVKASYPLLAEKFGTDMADSLKKSPVSIFDSLPLDVKRIIMRMANDPQPSPALTKA